MSHQTTITAQTPVDAAVEPADAVEVPLEPGTTLEAQVVTDDGPAVTVEPTGPTVSATAQPAPVTEAQVSAQQPVEAQVLNSGFITIVQDGGDPGFQEWAEFTYLQAGVNLVKAVAAGQIVTEVRVVVLEVFDGAASIQIGTAAVPDLWLDLSSDDLSEAADYHTDQLYKVTVAQTIRLILSAVGSTQGRIGLLYKITG